MAPHAPAFVSPVVPLPCRPSSTALSPSTCAPIRLQPTSSLRFPGSNGSPFGSFSPFSGVSNFFSFGSRASFGGSDSGPTPPGRGGGHGRGRNDGASGGGTADDSSNIFLSIWRAYNSRLDRFPITTKAFTSFIGFFLGDVIAQKFLGDKLAGFNWARVARMASFGFLIHGPTGHYFYSALDRLIVGTTPLKVISKVAIDQILWAPIFTTMFFSYLGFTEGKSIDDVINKIKKDTWVGVSTSWKFWPIAHTINFAFVPTSQRLLYVNTLQVGYNVILSLIGNK